MQSLPQIHVIIPVYNCQNYIAETIDSVLNQAYPHLQIILVNDGSSDSSPSICDAYAALHSNIRVIHQKNGGVASARNAALEYLTPHVSPNAYVAFLDADDKWYPNFFDESTLSLLKQGFDLIGFQTVRSNHSLSRYQAPTPLKEGIYSGGASTVWKTSSTHFGSAFYSLSVIKKYALHFPDKLKINEDIIFSMQFRYLADRIFLKNRILYMYRNNQSSASHKRRNIIEKYTPMIDAYLRSDSLMQQYFTPHRGKLSEGTAMAAVYIVEVHEEHYRHFGSHKALREMIVRHPEYLDLITSPSFCNRPDSGLRWKFLREHPFKFRLRCYTQGLILSFVRPLYLFLMKISSVASILDKYRYPNPL